MAIIPNPPRLTLRFVGKSKPMLRATEFSPPKIRGEQHPPYFCTEGKSGETQFEWRAGVQALCICLIRYLCYPRSSLEKGIKFQFEGGKDHPAKTLDGNVGKANKANCWQQNIFGTNSEGDCFIIKYIKRKNANPTPKRPNYLLEIQHEELPQESITIELDGKIITDLAPLEKSADAIEDQWYEINPEFKSEWAKIKKARKLKVKTNALKAAKSTDKQTPLLETKGSAKELELPKATQTEKSLAELFRSIPVTSIISHITAAHLPARGEDAIDKFNAEFLSPDCINAVAEKVVEGLINEFCDFFYAEYDSSPNIKKSVAAVIASNKDLRAKLAAKVAGCGYRDMLSWFQSFSFFCDRQIVVEVEYALSTASEEPGFKEKFLLYAPERLPALIKWFSGYGCVVAVRLFEKINDEGRKNETRLNKLLNE